MKLYYFSLIFAD